MDPRSITAFVRLKQSRRLQIFFKGNRQSNRPENVFFRGMTADRVKVIRQLDSSKRAGPDGIPNMLLKPPAKEFTTSLSILFLRYTYFYF